ncbi:hypothetical protein F544_12380 [Bibersteinia trehalosi USDA-ARS-USMARC-190]|uniref:Uncharacterized protein n=1 Tax=Bibersteinia trehalosi USDA-ARS-USMARC-190 TaxID=1263832 RepID=W0R7N2_BIBTR|nr:hypothetical protein F544_12380 [Bibersteinia trehalosi USDA-ARS-USMARC-190]
MIRYLKGIIADEKSLTLPQLDVAVAHVEPVDAAFAVVVDSHQADSARVNLALD